MVTCPCVQYPVPKTKQKALKRNRRQKERKFKIRKKRKEGTEGKQQTLAMAQGSRSPQEMPSRGHQSQPRRSMPKPNRTHGFNHTPGSISHEHKPAHVLVKLA